MNDITIASAGIAPSRSPSLEKALRELAQMPVTEACVSGLCDVCCLFQTDLCMVAGRYGEGQDPSMRSAEQKNKS